MFVAPAQRLTLAGARKMMETAIAIAERWAAMEGGYPIIVGGECIGGIGVSGGNWELDDHVAREALGAIGATYKIDDK